MLVITLSIIATQVQAASFSFIATPNQTTVEKGGTVQVSLKIADINAGELGINTVESKLSYDKEFFENIKIDSKNNWSITYNEGNGELLAVLVTTGVTTNQEIGTITLKIKQNPSIPSGKINFTEVSSNDGKNMIPTGNQAVQINLPQETTGGSGSGNNGGAGQQGGQSTPSSTTTSQNNQKTSKTGTSTKAKTDSLSSKPIPKAGDKLYVIGVCILAMAAISIGAFVKFLQYKEK